MEKKLFDRTENRSLKSVKAVVWHWPAGDVCEIGKLWTWMNGNSRNSYHFLISHQATLQTRETNLRAIHCGHNTYTPLAESYFGKQVCSSKDSPNNYTIGVCILHDRPDGSYSADTLETAIELGAMLCTEFNLDPLKNFLRHSDITNEKKEPCPKGFFLDDGALWEDFKMWVSEYIRDKRGKNRRGV